MASSFIKGPLQMVASSICFALMAYFSKLVASQIPGAEIAFARFLVGILVVLVLAGCGLVNLRTTNKRLLFIRGTFGGMSVLLYFLALAGGSMTNSTLLNNSYPIFATLVAAVTIKERISAGAVFSLIIAGIGVGLLLHPEWRHWYWPDLLALLSGILAGVAVAIIRELRSKNESAWNVFFYLSLFGAIFSLILALPSWVWPDLPHSVLLLLAAFFALIGQLMMTSAFKYCTTAVGGVLAMTTTAFTAIIGILVMGEKFSFGESLGALLIVAGSVMVVWLSGLTNPTEFKKPKKVY